MKFILIPGPYGAQFSIFKNQGTLRWHDCTRLQGPDLTNNPFLKLLLLLFLIIISYDKSRKLQKLRFKH